MEHLRKIYTLMYFVKDYTEEESIICFINPHFSKAESYKVLLPRRIQFCDSQSIKGFSQATQKKEEIGGYLVFVRGDKPDFCSDDEVIWDENGWGIWRVLKDETLK